MGPRSLSYFIATVLSVAHIICFAPSAGARVSSAHGGAAAGRELALRVCTGCHIVSPDQPFPPVITRTPSPPDFRTIANMPTTTVASLRRFLSTLRPVPMPEPHGRSVSEPRRARKHRCIHHDVADAALSCWSAGLLDTKSPTPFSDGWNGRRQG
jgi:hypothetical protein